MQHLSLSQRVALADRIRLVRQEIAEEVTEEFLTRHPDWLDRYGDRARRFGIEDACFHQDFLSGAIDAGSMESFQEYARWVALMLQTRGIAPEFLVENLQQIESALAKRLPEVDSSVICIVIRSGLDAAATIPSEFTTSTIDEMALSRSVYLQALLQGARKPALTVVLEALNQGKSISDIYIDLLQEVMYEIGRLWQTNRITVAEEHTATAITQYVMAQLYERLPHPTVSRGKAVITGVAGELHQLGANMVADTMEAGGWDVRFLGTNMPHDGILKVIDDHQASVVGISATMLFNVPAVRRLIDDIRAKTSRTTRILLGGGAFRSAPNLFHELGADGFAPDLRSATELLRSFHA